VRETDTRQHTYLCPVWDCRARFRTRIDFQIHCRYEFLFDPKVDKFICGVDGCSFRGRSEDWMPVHKVEHQASITPNPGTPMNSTFGCPVCNLHFATPLILESHLERVHRPIVGCPTVLQCPYCFKKFGKPGILPGRTTLRAYWIHFEGVHVKGDPQTDPRRKKYACPVYECTSRFRTKVHLDIHHRKFHEKDPNPFKCDACPKAYTTAAYLRVHKSRNHTEPKACPICGEGIYERGKMLGHINQKHSSAQNFQCGICKWNFYYEEDWGVHEKLHKPKYICVLGKCKFYRFKDPTDYGNEVDLRLHIEAILSRAYGRPFECKVCGNRYCNQLGLDNHMEKKNHYPNNVIYKCPLCPSTFNSRISLYHHKRRWHKRRPNPNVHRTSLKTSIATTVQVEASTSTRNNRATATKRKRKKPVVVSTSTSDADEWVPDSVHQVESDFPFPHGRAVTSTGHSHSPHSESHDQLQSEVDSSVHGRYPIRKRRKREK